MKNIFILLICYTDALIWKEAFEKAKKIVGSECEIYAGKNNPEQKHTESDSESSDVSYSESTDNEEPTKSPIKQSDGSNATSQQNETEKEVTKSAEDKYTVTKSEEKLIEEIKKLEVKNEDENK